MIDKNKATTGGKEQKPRFAKKSLGQNFLVDKTAISKIANEVPEKSSLVLEIGPGRGALSTELFPRAEKFCVLEKDDLFAKNIGETLFVHGSRHHYVFHDDALEFSWDKIWEQTESSATTPLIVVSNLPYNVGTEILFRLLEISNRIPRMVLMFQKEVARRIAAPFGSKDFGSISVFVQNYYQVRLLQVLRPVAFRPSPKVDSAVLVFERREKPLLSFHGKEEEKQFRAFVRSCFAHRRKTIENSLRMEKSKLPDFASTPVTFWSEVLREAKVNSQRRAETLSIEEFGALFKTARAML